MKIKIVLMSVLSSIVLFCPPRAFAETVSVIGTIESYTISPVGGKILFKDAVTKKDVVLGTIDPMGNYTVSIPTGIYDITIVPPSGSGLTEVTERNQHIASDTVKNLSLPAKNSSYHQIQSLLSKINIVGAVIALDVFVIVVITYTYLKKRRNK